MKNTFKILCLFVGALIILSACKEDSLLVYENENNVYFQHKRWLSGSEGFSATMTYEGVNMAVKTTSRNTALDSLSASTALLSPEIPSDIIFLPVMLMGQTADRDRDFGWKIVNTNHPDAGVENEDYKVLAAYIPANRTIGGIVIEIFRKNLGGEKFFYADFELVPNENFKTNFNENTRSSSKSDEKVSTITMRLKFTDGLTKPAAWDTWVKAYFGEWSTKKAVILNVYISMPLDYIYGSSQNDVLSANYGFAFKRWLDDYKKEHGEPMYEEDGETVMTAGEKVV